MHTLLTFFCHISLTLVKLAVAETTNMILIYLEADGDVNRILNVYPEKFPQNNTPPSASFFWPCQAV